MKLAELQMRFQGGIVKGDNAILASIVDSRRTDRATLFAVYHDAYRMRLAEFLSHDFPVLRVHLGEEAFGRLVEDFIEFRAVASAECAMVRHAPARFHARDGAVAEEPKRH